jgi:hypothetical protein
MALTNSLVASSGTVIFYAGSEQAITTVILCNTDASTDTVIDVYAVANGGVTGASTLILNNLSLPAKETFVMDSEKLILDVGDQLVAVSSEDLLVSATVSSVSI